MTACIQTEWRAELWRRAVRNMQRNPRERRKRSDSKKIKINEQLCYKW